jgi:hypothetical protein
MSQFETVQPILVYDSEDETPEEEDSSDDEKDGASCCCWKCRFKKADRPKCTACCYGCAGCGGLFLVYLLIEVIIYIALSGQAQCWLLESPGNPIAQFFVTPVYVAQSLGVGNPSNMIALQSKWGDNFCASGQVWLSSYDDVSTALLEPQKRNARLGEHPLIPGHLPIEGGRLVFLLALGNTVDNASLGEGGPGDHKLVRKSFIDAFLEGSAQSERKNDNVTQALWLKLERDYQNDRAGFYTSETSGIYYFVSRYLHHVLLGIGPESNDWGTLDAFYFGEGPMAYYLAPVGYLSPVGSTIAAIIDIYAKSPAMVKYAESGSLKGLTEQELAGAVNIILRLAGIQGTQAMIKSITGNWGLPCFPDNTDCGAMSVTQVWDNLTLTDPTQVNLYITEALRLTTPVTVSNRIATEDFSVQIGGSFRNFPKGTAIGIPLFLANTDKKTLGRRCSYFQYAPRGPLDHQRCLEWRWQQARQRPLVPRQEDRHGDWSWGPCALRQDPTHNVQVTFKSRHRNGRLPTPRN